MTRGKLRGARRAPVGSVGAARAILTRINTDGLRALHQLALDQDTTAQALMIEALNDLFRKYRRPIIARTPSRPR